MTRRALITGITGQDGSYLAEFLLDKGYEVHGIIRRASTFNTVRIDRIFDQLHLYHGDMTDGTCLRHVLNESQPDEVYNLAAQSHVKVSFECSEFTMDVVAMGTLRLLEAIREMPKPPKMYQASSSEMYGDVIGMWNEEGPFNPVSPYGIAKLAAHCLCLTYREAYGLPISCGILFNHESPRRGETFVTRKVCRAAVRIEAGRQALLRLGNLNASRDWGYAGDYVKAMWRMLQAEPDDFVIATGVSHTVEELCRYAFGMMNLDWSRYVLEDERYKRPVEVPHLRGDARKAKRVLGWEPVVSFEQLVEMMVLAEQEELK